MSQIKQIVDLITKRFLDAGGIIHIPIYPENYDLEIDLIGKVNNRCYIIAARFNNPDSMANAMVLLYEAQYREGLEESILIIALTESINRSKEWLKDYYENDRNIKLLWLDGDELQATKQTQKTLDFLWSGTFVSSS